MAARSNVNVLLPPELGRFVNSRVRSGRYESVDQVIREALRLLEIQERDGADALKELRMQLQRGSDQADRGEFVDPDEVLKKIEGIKRQRRGRR